MNSKNNYKYILEPYKGKSSRFTCPNCGKSKTFVRYIDTETGKHISREVGRCNRESNCGYHYTPKQYFKEYNFDFKVKKITPHRHAPKKIISFIPANIFKLSLQQYERNNFVQYLILLFDENVTSELISRYFIGTSKHWEGATVFWQIDKNGNVRAGKIMLYNPVTGKRIKEPFSHISWVHSAMKFPEYNLKQCFFGEHLLNGNLKPVAIVESEKTAIIASVCLPDFIWLATGSSVNLKEENFKVLQGRNVVLFPDLNCFKKWNKKANELSHIAKISVSALLEHSTGDEEKANGYDLADYLIQSDIKKIVQSPENEFSQEPEPKPKFQTVGDFFDLLKARGYNKLPSNFLGANAGIWKSQIN